LNGYFNSNEVGEPGPRGSDPRHLFPGIDTFSRAKNNFSTYGTRYSADLSSVIRVELSGGYFQNNNGDGSTYGFSFNKDERAQGDARAIVSVWRHDTLSLGVSAGHDD
jgi:hypothetical protein